MYANRIGNKFIECLHDVQFQFLEWLVVKYVHQERKLYEDEGLELEDRKAYSYYREEQSADGKHETVEDEDF